MENWALNLIFDRPEDRAIAAETLAAALDDLGSLGWQEKASAARDNLRENLRLNHVARQGRLFAGDAAAYASRHRRGAGFDLIVCNILFEKMRPLLGHFGKLVRRDAPATVIVSGFLWAERRAAAAALAAAGIEIACERKTKDWGAMAGKIRAAESSPKAVLRTCQTRQ